MISAQEMDMYPALFQEKKMTERLVGIFPLKWTFSEVHYRAECTEGIPFTLFDKIIIGILLIDEVLSIEQIGGILGFNVIYNSEEGQYKDEAEFDILRQAIDALADYQMLEIGDIYYSACRLTSTGREYARKGMKFKTVDNKPFALIFDHLTNDHIVAKSALENLPGERKQIKLEEGIMAFTDEPVMKEIALVQRPDVYNLDRGNSFKNPILNTTKSATFYLELQAVLLFDFKEKHFRLLGFDPYSKKKMESLTRFLGDSEDVREQYIQKFLSRYADFHMPREISEEQCDYEQQLWNYQQLFDEAVVQQPEEVTKIIKRVNTKLDFIEQSYFFNNLPHYLDEDTHECFLFLKEPNLAILKVLRELIGKKKLPPFFFVFQQSNEKEIIDEITEFYEHCLSLSAPVYSLVFREVSETEFWVIKGNEVVDICVIAELHYTYGEKRFSLEHMQQKATHMDYIRETYEEVKGVFAQHFLPIINTQIQEGKETGNVITKESIREAEEQDLKAKIFINLNHHSNILEQLESIEITKKEIVQKLKFQHRKEIREKITALSKSLIDKPLQSLELLQTYIQKSDKIKDDFFPEYKTEQQFLSDLLQQIKQEEKRIRDEILAKTYVVDTNIFVKFPDILSEINQKHYVALTLTVLEELDILKQRTDVNIKANVRKAIRNINEALKKNKDRIRKARTNLEILPEEFRQKKGDNYLLAMAMMYKDKNPVLLTEDQNLQSKAMMLDISVESYHEALNTADRRPSGSDNYNFNPIEVFDATPLSSNGKKTISQFLKTLRKKHPGFDYRKQGYDKAWKFCNDIPGIKVIDRQYLILEK